MGAAVLAVFLLAVLRPWAGVTALGRALGGLARAIGGRGRSGTAAEPGEQQAKRQGGGDDRLGAEGVAAHLAQRLQLNLGEGRQEEGGELRPLGAPGDASYRLDPRLRPPEQLFGEADQSGAVAARNRLEAGRGAGRVDGVDERAGEDPPLARGLERRRPHEADQTVGGAGGFGGSGEGLAGGEQLGHGAGEAA